MMMLSRPYNNILNNTGSVLISLIITMVVLAALGAAMVSLTSTSMFGQVGANSSARAYFLAESGYRYAESRYLAATGETARDTVLESLHNDPANPPAFSLLNNAGQFDLQIYPYYFKVNTRPIIGAADQLLETRVFGGFPPPGGVTIGKPGWLKIGPKSTSIYKYDDFSVSDRIVTFKMHDLIMSYFPVGLDLLHAAEIKDPQTVTKGGDLQVRDQTSGMPLRNGILMIKNRPYSYKENDVANRKFIGIEDPADPNMPNFTVLDQDKIVLQKFVKLHSTGIFGQGSGEGAASRELVYHVPLPTTSDQEKKTYIETEWGTLDATPTNWTAVERMHLVKTVGVNKVLKITTPPVVGFEDTGLIKFNWSSTDVNLTNAHQAAGYFLSYDAQVKIGFDPQPDFWQFPPGSPFPTLYVAGITFRLNTTNKGYGVSLLRGDNSFIASPKDGIPDVLIPVDRSHMVVLWQQTSLSSWIWLAYKQLPSIPISANNEATLMVRVVEGAGMSFSGSNGVPIEKGDIIVGKLSSARATVNSAPLVQAPVPGVWSINASGTLTLQNISGNFLNFEQLQVVGSSATATYSPPLRPRDNYIKVYIGNTTGNGTPNTTPTDNQYIGNPQGDVNWPLDNADDTAPETDFFQLVQWDVVNPAYSADINLVFRTGFGKESNAIIRSNKYFDGTASTTCSPCVFNQPELGLHTMGNSLNFIYFDEFATQTETAAGNPTGFVRTIQE